MSNDYFKSKGWLTNYAQAEDSTGMWQNYVKETEDRDARIMELVEVKRSEMDNFNTPDLDQGADSILRPGETLDDFDVTFRKPNSKGGFQQLVQNTNDGSRPGYKGKPYLDQTQFIEEFTKQRIKGDKTTAEFVEYLNNNYKPSPQTDKFNIGNVDRRMRVLQKKGLISTDIVTKGSKANLALTPEKYISLLGEEGYAAVKDNPTLLKSRYEYAREKKNNPNFLEQRKIRRQKWVDSLTPEQYREKVTVPALELKQKKFPTKFTVYRDSARSLAWKDLVSRTYEYDISKKKSKGTPYFKFETPLEKGKNHNTADMKKIVLIDKNNNRFTYDTLFDDVKKVAGEKESNMFKNTYEQRAFMNKDGITTELNKLYNNQPGSYKSVFNVQHIEGFNKNPFKVHMTFATQNAAENKSRRIFTEQFGKASKIPLDGKGNKGARFIAQKVAINNYYNSLGDDIVAQISKKPKGVAKPLMELLNLTPIKLTNSQTKGVTAIDNDIKKRLTTISKAGGSKAKAAIKALAILAGSTGAAVADDGSEGTGGMLKDAAIAGGAVGTVGTKAGRKLLGNLFNAAGLPASLAFNYFAGIDADSSLDRTILGAELATAPSLIKSATTVVDKVKNPLLKKAAQFATTISPTYAAKIARFTQPVGIATLGGELAYKVATQSEPNILINKETGDPTAFDRENASDVFPSMIDANEQAYNLSKQKGISYEDAVKEIDYTRLKNLKND